jgi:hypothetical protein
MVVGQNQAVFGDQRPTATRLHPVGDRLISLATHDPQSNLHNSRPGALPGGGIEVRQGALSEQQTEDNDRGNDRGPRE